MTGSQDDFKLAECPAQVAIKVISGKWKTRVLWLLRDRPYHFGELKRRLPGVTGKVLSEQLSQLEAAGVLTQSEENVGAVRQTLYGYSVYGQSLVPALDALGHWGLIHLEEVRKRESAPD